MELPKPDPPNVPPHQTLAAAKPLSDEIAQIAAGIGRDARAAAVFGEPVQQDGTLIVPAARLIWGFGGGGSPASRGARSTGGGGGGGAMLVPHGYLELRRGRAHYRRIGASSRAFVLGVIAGACVSHLALRWVRRSPHGVLQQSSTVPLTHGGS